MRARFGRFMSVVLNGNSAPPVAELLRLWPAKRVPSEQGDLVQGLAVRFQLQRPDVTADLDLGEGARFWPCDEALARWRSLAQGGPAVVVYE